MVMICGLSRVLLLPQIKTDHVSSNDKLTWNGITLLQQLTIMTTTTGIEICICFSIHGISLFFYGSAQLLKRFACDFRVAWIRALPHIKAYPHGEVSEPHSISLTWPLLFTYTMNWREWVGISRDVSRS